MLYEAQLMLASNFERRKASNKNLIDSWVDMLQQDPLKEHFIVGTWASLEDGQAHVPTLLS